MACDRSLGIGGEQVGQALAHGLPGPLGHRRPAHAFEQPTDRVVEAVLQQGDEEVLLAVEGPVEGPLRQTGPTHDPVHRGRPVAAASELDGGCVQQLPARGVRVS